jgi:uridine monophosphate synthetase
MSSPKPEPDALLEAFWEKGLILCGESVRREYALHTPIFINLRHKLYDDLELLSQLAHTLHERLRSIVAAECGGEERRQQIIGIPDTATPLALSAALVSQRTAFKLHYGQMRKKPAAYPGGEKGTSAYMGTRDREREITLIDDVMASGRTKLWAIEELAKEGLKVARVLVVVDREQGGTEILREKGCPVHSLYRVSSLIEYCEATGKLAPETARVAVEHLRSKRFL